MAPLYRRGATLSRIWRKCAQCRRLLSHRHPEWLLDSSPGAFAVGGRPPIVKTLLDQLNLDHRHLADAGTSLRKLRGFLTPDIVPALLPDLSSQEPHKRANAMLALSLLRIPDVVPTAVTMLQEHQLRTPSRYAAILALINASDHTIIPTLITFLKHEDALFINIVDCIGSLCTRQLTSFSHSSPVRVRDSQPRTTTFANSRRDMHSRPPSPSHPKSGIPSWA